MSPFLDLEPWQQGSFRFETPLPGSKSLTLRDCGIAALADGDSTVRFPGECDDYWRMKDCLRRLGIDVDDSRAGRRAHRRPRWRLCRRHASSSTWGRARSPRA